MSSSGWINVGSMLSGAPGPPERIYVGSQAVQQTQVHGTVLNLKGESSVNISAPHLGFYDSLGVAQANTALPGATYAVGGGVPYGIDDTLHVVGNYDIAARVCLGATSCFVFIFARFKHHLDNWQVQSLFLRQNHSKSLI